MIENIPPHEHGVYAGVAGVLAVVDLDDGPITGFGLGDVDAEEGDINAAVVVKGEGSGRKPRHLCTSAEVRNRGCGGLRWIRRPLAQVCGQGSVRFIVAEIVKKRILTEEIFRFTDW